MTDAAIGYGSEFGVGDGGGPETFTPVAEVFEITPPGLKADTVDATHMASPGAWREFIPGLLDPGEVQIQMNFIPGGADQDTLFAALSGRAVKNYKITFPNAEEWVFSAFATGVTPAIPLDGKMTLTAMFKLSGQPDFVT